MNLKKLKRLLSLTLTAAMVASMISVPVNAETVTDNTAAVMEEMIANPAGEDAANDAEGTDVADVTEEVGDVADETEDSDVADETEDEGTAEAAEEELFSGSEAGGDGAGSGDGQDSGTTTTPEAPTALVVGDGEDQYATLQAAIAEATKDGATLKKIELSKNIELAEGITLAENSGVEIDTKGHSIVIPAAANVTLTNVNITNSVAKKGVTILSQGTLTIAGGEYTTMGGQMLRIEGTANISGATIECPSDAGTTENNWYDGLPIISVHGVNGKLTMTSGTINANVGNGSNCGMYGIYLLEGAEVVLGLKDAQNSALTVNSVFSAIAMNGLTAPGRITVNSGTYNSSVKCSADNEKKFNSVIYLPSTANVNINGGVFAATAESEDAHVISIPYDKVGLSSVRVNLNITAGTFTSQGSVFNHPYAGTNTTKARIAISGGTFSSDLKTELANTGIADGYQVYEQTDGAGKKSYTVSTSSIVTVNSVPYNNLQQAITAAKAGKDDAGKTITLGKDLELTDPSYDLEDVIVNTAGHMFTVPEGKSVTLTKGTVRNNEFAVFSSEKGEITNSRTMFQVDGSLTINGGTYETKGSHLMRVSGEAVIGGEASFSGTAASTEISNLGSYDGASLISVTGTEATLTVKNATINATVGNATNTDGMYGIYVNHGAELVLGAGDEVPTITSTLAAVGMNGLTAPGKITINGGTYTSKASVTAENLKNFNAVLYLPASANVTINNGTFVAAGTAGERHVISVPYNMVNGKHVKLNLIINDGTFKVANPAEGDAIFFDAGMDDQDGEKTANQISVRGGTFNPGPTYVAGCHERIENEDGSTTVDKTENGEHTLTWVAMQKATCWEEGVIGHYECLNCHKMYNKKTTDKKELFAEDVAIPREEHVGNGTPVNRLEPTCTTAGREKYVKCEKCGLCYESQDALDKDTKGEVGVPESEKIIPANGHTYPKETNEDGSQGDFVIDINSRALDYNHFVEGQANGVVVTRTCSVCGKVEEGSTVPPEAIQTASKVAVTAKEGNPEINCQERQTLNYTAAASFDKFTTDKDGNLTVNNGVDTVVKDFSFETTKGSHSYDLTTVSFNWDNFDIATFKDGEANGVTATGVCKVCGNDEVEAIVTVRSTDYPAAGSDLDCAKTYHFTATATFGTGTDAPAVPSAEKEFPGVHTLTWKQDYEAPTCLKPGQWGAVECTVCHKFFLGEDSAKVNDSKTAAELVIPKRDHALQLKGFSWTNDDQTEAKATFWCTSCKKTVDVEVDDENITLNKEKSETKECGVEVNQVYDVSVEFEKSAVTVVDDKFVYNPTTDGTKTRYPGTLNKKALQPHIFVTEGEEGQPATANVVLKWMDTNSDDATVKHNVDQGVKAIITCATCGKHITVASKGGIIDGETTIPDNTLVIPYVKLALNETESAKTKATCVAEGTAVYDVTVSYDDGTGMQELDSKPISTKTPIDGNAHAWTELEWKEWVEEEPVKTVDGVRIPPVYSVKATRHCSNVGCKTYPGAVLDENGQPTTDEDGNPVIKEQAFATVTTVPEDKNAPYILVEKDEEQKKTCIRSGITNYIATAYFNGEAVENGLGEEDHPTPAVFNDPVEGHKIELKWDWAEQRQDSTDVNSPVTKLTGLTVERYCPNCSDSTDPDVQGKPWVVPHDTYTLEIAENATEQNPSIDKEGKLSVYKVGKDATCNESGTSRYIATLNYTQTDVYENTRVLVNAALGHDMKWFITWGKDNEKGEGSEKWVATMQKKCTRNDVSEGTPTDAVIKHDINPATCLAQGTEEWTITNLPSQKDEDYAADTEKSKSKTLLIDMTNGHDYNVATVTPATAPEVRIIDGVEKEVLAVTFARTCKNAETDPTHTDTRVLYATTQDKPVDCSLGYVLNFGVDSAEVTALTDAGWEMPEGQVYTFKYEVQKAEGRTNHNLVRVSGGSSNDCNAEIYPTYYECKRCGKRYTTQSALTEYTGPGKGDGEAQGHLYGDPVFSWIEEGRTVQATFTCTRTGCPDKAEGGNPHTLTLVAHLEDTPYVEIPAECKDSDKVHTTESGLELPAGIGYAWGLVTLKITEGTAQDNLNVGDYFEGELGMYLDHADHNFKNGICEWCGLEGGVVINFYGRTDALVSHLDCSSKEGKRPTVETLTLPTAPNQIGYEFLGWSLTKGAQVASNNIKQEICDLCTEDKTINVYAVYKAIEDKGKVRVDKVLRTKGSEDVVTQGSVEEVVIGSKYSATADSVENYHFSHWEKDNEVLGTDISYSMYVQTTNLVVLKAVYVPDESEVEQPGARVVITDVYGSVVDTVEKLSFVSAISDIPEGWTISGSGFVYSVKDGIAESDLTLEKTEVSGSGVLKSALNGTQTNIMTVKIGSANKARTVSARAYVIYTNGTEAKTVYSAMKATSYNDAPKK